MSNIQFIIEERAAQIGNFLVGRLLPFREKRSVGPFVFIDHMGPALMSEFENLDVGPHPHIGLSTLTFLFEGSIAHKDSLGSDIEITPEAVNWMTAGRGIVHSERTPEALRHTDKNLHGLQIWVALPKALEQMEPSFVHIEKDAIPRWNERGLQFKLIAGEVMGRKSPVPVYSPLYFIEIKSVDRQLLSLAADLYGESALYILEGEITSEGNSFGPKQILIAKDSKLCEFEMGANTTIYLFGGDAFPEERLIDWNFVATDQSLIEAAKENWKQQRFPKVPKDDDYVAYPEKPFKNRSI